MDEETQNHNRQYDMLCNICLFTFTYKAYEQHEKDMDKNYFDQQFKSYNIQTFTYQFFEEIEKIELNIETELQYFMHKQILKPKYQQLIRQFLFFQTKKIQQLIKDAFIFALVIKFPEISNSGLDANQITKQKQRLNSNYIQIFNFATKLNNDEIVASFIYIVCYMTHYLLFKYLNNKHQQDLRFVLDIYHIIIFEMNGMYVSDQFIKQNVEKFFQQQKFLEYETQTKTSTLNKSKKMTIKKQLSEDFMKVQKPINYEKNYQIQSDVNEFQRVLQDRFKGFKKLKYNIQQLVQKKQDQDQMIQEKEEERKILQERSDMLQRNLGVKNLVKINNFKSTFTNSFEGILNKICDFFGFIDNNKSNMTKTMFKNNETLGNMHLNCYQLSPAMSQMLNYQNMLDLIMIKKITYLNFFGFNFYFFFSQIQHMSLPHRKKIIRYTFEKPDTKSADLMERLKNQGINGNIIKKKGSSKQYDILDDNKLKNISMFDKYSLSQPKKEYYQKHPQEKGVNKLFKEMLDLNYVLQNHQQGFQQLPSSVSLFKNLQKRYYLEKGYKHSQSDIKL